MALKNGLKRIPVATPRKIVDAAAWRASAAARWVISYADRQTTHAGRKRVLIGATGPLALSYGLSTWESIADVPAVEGYFSAMSDFDVPSELSTRAAQLGLREIDRRFATHRWWDAVLLADHVSKLRFPAGIPRVSIGHGLSVSKKWRGQGYQLDPGNVRRRNGSPVYKLYLGESREEADKLLALYPVYAGRVVVVGDIRADRMLDLASRDRAELKRELGIQSDLVAVIMSTWDEFSLMETIGHELMAALPLFTQTNQDVTVVITMHPRLWGGHRAVHAGAVVPRIERTRTDWARLVSAARSDRVVVIGPNEEWEPYLAIADVAIADHTSLASTFGLLKRPIVPIRVPPEILLEGSFARLVQERMRPVDTAAQALDEVLHGAYSRTMDESLRSRSDSLLDNRGNARSATRDALLELLGLSEPGPGVPLEGE